MGEKVINLNYRYLNICKYGPWEEMKTNDILYMYKLVSVHVWVVVTSDRGTWYELWEPEDDLITVSMVTTCHLCPTTDTRPPNQTKPSPATILLVTCGQARPPACPVCQIVGYFFWLWSIATIYQTHFISEYTITSISRNVWRKHSFSSDFAPLKLTRLICSSARVR